MTQHQTGAFGALLKETTDPTFQTTSHEVDRVALAPRTIGKTAEGIIKHR